MEDYHGHFKPVLGNVFFNLILTHKSDLVHIRQL